MIGELGSNPAAQADAQLPAKIGGVQLLGPKARPHGRCQRPQSCTIAQELADMEVSLTTPSA